MDFWIDVINKKRMNESQDDLGVRVKFPFFYEELKEFLELAPSDKGLWITDYQLPFKLASFNDEMILRLSIYSDHLKLIEGSSLAKEFMPVARKYFDGCPKELLRHYDLIQHYDLLTLEDFSKHYLIEKFNFYGIDKELLNYVDYHLIGKLYEERYNLLVTKNGIFQPFPLPMIQMIR